VDELDRARRSAGRAAARIDGRAFKRTHQRRRAGGGAQREFTQALARAVGHHTFAPVPAFVLRAIFQEMADEMLLASTRVRPQRLLEAGFSFAHPELDGALRAALA